MSENSPRPFQTKIIDFNPSRMNEDEARNIPLELRPFVADKRQYPFNIARHFPTGILWFNPNQPWFYRNIISSEHEIASLSQNDTLILSGSGMSAYHFQEGNFNKLPKPEDVNLLRRTEQLVRDQLGEGKWVLGICFGGQLAVHAIGGRIGRLPTKENGNTVTEAGWLDQQSTPEGQKDKVFGSLSKVFSAPHLHSDYVERLPAIGTEIRTSSGRIKVVNAKVLSVRSGYLDTEGLKNRLQGYIQATVIEFDNGTKLYQIQPHPEMATSDKANFLVRQNPWIAKEMGEKYYAQALKIPLRANMAVARIIPRFIEEAREAYELQNKITFTRAAITQSLGRLTPYLIK